MNAFTGRDSGEAFKFRNRVRARRLTSAIVITPISGRSAEGFGNPNMDRRITPRSPRAALEPEHVPVPTRRSKRVRNPLVIIGNAIFTLLILLVIGGGAAVVFGKLRFEAPGPLQADKIVNIPPRAGLVEIADILQREGVMDEHKLVFIGGVLR